MTIGFYSDLIEYQWEYKLIERDINGICEWDINGILMGDSGI